MFGSFKADFARSMQDADAAVADFQNKERLRKAQAARGKLSKTKTKILVLVAGIATLSMIASAAQGRRQ